MTRCISTPAALCTLGLLLSSCSATRPTASAADSAEPRRTGIELNIPELQELAYVAVALTPTGQADSNMVDMTTAYYTEAMEHFRPWADHALIDTLAAHIRAPRDMDSYWYYYAVVMNACAYRFEGGRILPERPDPPLGFDNIPDPIRAHRGLFEDFARVSGFREFHRLQLPYYDSLKATYGDLNPVGRMQQWLEGRFGFGYESYTICFGPLVGGAHATTRSGRGRKGHTTMFVSRAEPFADLGANLNRMIHSRVVFTEIDHNFVNPESRRFRRDIRRALADRASWVDDTRNGAQAYESAQAVFNEYMTWSLFSLYCLDQYPEADVQDFLPRMERQMVEDRGFIRFREFNRALMEVYRQQPGTDGRALVKAMVLWCKAPAGTADTAAGTAGKRA